MLLAILRDGPINDPFHTFTWGIPGCDDARYAKEVAAKAGTEHHFFELKPDWLWVWPMKVSALPMVREISSICMPWPTLEDEADTPR